MQRQIAALSIVAHGAARGHRFFVHWGRILLQVEGKWPIQWSLWEYYLELSISRCNGSCRAEYGHVWPKSIATLE